MRKLSQVREHINTGYILRSGASVLACYGMIVEYFSNGDFPLPVLFKNYGLYYELEAARGRDLEQAVSRHFHGHCSTHNMKKLGFIHELHVKDLLNTRICCRIRASRAEPHLISVKDTLKLRIRLTDGGLALVLYPVNHSRYHAVIVGYDEKKLAFFIRDPAKKYLICEDFLHDNRVQEYLLFEPQPTA